MSGKIRQPIVTVLGHVDHGKCISSKTRILLADGRILTSKEIFEQYKNDGIPKELDDGIVFEIKNGPEIFTFDGVGVKKTRITHLWKLNSPSNLIKIKVKSGHEIETTSEHPFLIWKDGKLSYKRADEISIDDFVLIPKKIRGYSDIEKAKEYIFKMLVSSRDLLVFLKDDATVFKKLETGNLQLLKKRGIFTTDPYSCISKKRFRSSDFIKICSLFGISPGESYSMIKTIKNASHKQRVGHTSNHMKLPQTEEEFHKLGYILGCMAGDGYINEGKLCNNDPEIQQTYVCYIDDVLGLSCRIRDGHTCKEVITNGGLTYVRFLIDICGFPSKEKSNNVRIPEIVLYDDVALSLFIRGWFDTDGYVSNLNNTVEITSKSESMVKQASFVLLRFGVVSSVFKKNDYWVIRIGNKNYLEKFFSFINSNLTYKRERIANAISKTTTSRIFDITPIKGSEIGSFRIKNADKHLPYYTKYKKYNYLSSNFLRQVASISDINHPIFEIISKDEVCFVRVASTEIIETDDSFVYDFTVPGTHNFIAEGYFVHNTTLLDKIRRTTIAEKEPGQITQAIGTTEVPKNVIEKICGLLLEKFKFKVAIPGLLFIDTPGHEAFTTLRKRGGSIADLAILVIDVLEGMKPQTIESFDILCHEKTPFVVALNKIDRIEGWKSEQNNNGNGTNVYSFLGNLENQSDMAKGKFEDRFYRSIGNLSENCCRIAGKDINFERFDRVHDFRKTIAVVPVSGKTGEGIPELLAVLVGLSQQFLHEQLVLTGEAKGTVLEVKDTPGLGKTIDVIIYDGILSKNDYLIIGGKAPMITRIKAMLIPEPLRDIRTEKKFITVEECHAACGVKIAAPNLEGVVAGSPVRSSKSLDEAEKIFMEFESEKEEIEITTENEGLVLKADTIGGLEALVSIFKEHPIREATLGNISKEAIMKAEANKDPAYRIVIGFNTSSTDEAKFFARDDGIKILESDIIYHLIEEYEKWTEQAKEELKKKEIDSIVRPGKMRILSGYVFRASNPAIVGCEVNGAVKPGYRVFKADESIKEIGEIKQIQKEGENLESAKAGDRVAISIAGPTVGRQINEEDVLYTDVSSDDYKKLKQFEKLLSHDEKQILHEIFLAKRKHDPRYGL